MPAARAWGARAREAGPQRDHQTAGNLAVESQARAWQFLDRLAQLPDNLTETATLGFPLIGVEAAAPSPVAVASGRARAQATVNATAPVRHSRRLTHGATPGSGPAAIS